jgi:hypothetical protein
MTGKRRWLPFIAGMLTGILLTASLAFSAALIGANQTWLLRINTHGVADKMEGAAQLMVAELLPVYIENLKAGIPDLVAVGVSNQFDDAQFQLGGEQFALPQAFVDRLEQNYRNSLTEAIYDLLNTLPLDKMGDELALEIIGIVENSLYAEFNSRQIDIELIGGAMSVPMLIELVNQPGEQSFHLQLFSTQPEDGY